MAISLHVATTYKVRYKDHGMWHCQEQFNHFIVDECESTSFDDECLDFASRLEINREELYTLIDKMKQDNERWDERLSEAEIPMSANDMANLLQQLYDEADQENEFIILEWY